ncbi:MAG: hypothetical protein ABIF01_05460 [Candidatus Micrarchaeota archaeon]
MNVTRYGWEPDTFVLKKGIPVKWIINGKEITGCNNEIIVREYGLDIKLKKGEQTVEFTPSTAKTVSWSCWMGMIQGKFIVVENDAAQEEAVKAVSAGTTPTASSAGGSCGVGGCGAQASEGETAGSCGVSSGGSCGGGGCGCGCGGAG